MVAVLCQAFNRAYVIPFGVFGKPLNRHVVDELVLKICRHNDTSFNNRLIRNENILYLGGIVLNYCLNKEKIFDGGDDKDMPR